MDRVEVKLKFSQIFIIDNNNKIDYILFGNEKLIFKVFCSEIKSNLNGTERKVSGLIVWSRGGRKEETEQLLKLPIRQWKNRV